MTVCAWAAETEMLMASQGSLFPVGVVSLFTKPVPLVLVHEKGGK